MSRRIHNIFGKIAFDELGAGDADVRIRSSDRRLVVGHGHQGSDLHEGQVLEQPEGRMVPELGARVERDLHQLLRHHVGEAL